MIHVEQTKTGDPMEFRATVREGGGETSHEVTMKKADYDRLTDGKVEPVECVRAAFAFLLDREPKESILRRFDVTVIGRYFPDFERQIGAYLGAKQMRRGE